jgi:hypothetical protein
MTIRRPPRGALLLLVALALAACARGDGTEELRDAIERYRTGEAEKGEEERIDAMFARLDARIADLRAEAATREGEARARREQEADALASRRSDLHGAYLAARFARLGDAAGDALRSAGEALGKKLEEAGRKMQEPPQPEPAD